MEMGNDRMIKTVAGYYELESPPSHCGSLASPRDSGYRPFSNARVSTSCRSSTNLVHEGAIMELNGAHPVPRVSKPLGASQSRQSRHTPPVS
jgi:hypothetical protein